MILRNIISEDVRKYFLKISDKLWENQDYRESFNENSFWVRPFLHKTKTNIQPIITLKRTLFNNLGVIDLEPENKHIHIAYYREGGFVPPHQHNFKDIRFNILISEPDLGGVHYNKNFIKVSEGDLWTFKGYEDHGTSEVIGKKPRIVISFGAIEDDQVTNFL